MHFLCEKRNDTRKREKRKKIINVIIIRVNCSIREWVGRDGGSGGVEDGGHLQNRDYTFSRLRRHDKWTRKDIS